MSLENVRSFYIRMATDTDFRGQMQEAESQEICQQIVQEAGYTFTQQELEEFTAKLLEQDTDEGELRDVDEKELEAVMGGVSRLFPLPWIVLLYGVVMSKLL